MGNYVFGCPDLLRHPYFIPGIFRSAILKKRQANITVISYQKPYLEYQYPGESIEVIKPRICGELTYECRPINTECPGLSYSLVYERAEILNGTFSHWTRFKVSLPLSIADDGPFDNFRLLVKGISVEHRDPNGNLFHWAFKQAGYDPKGDRKRVYQIICDSNTQNDVTILTSSTTGIKIVGIELTNLDDAIYCPTFYDFIVKENDAVVFERRDKFCPSVNLFDCSVNLETRFTKKIALNKDDIFILVDGKAGLLPVLAEVNLSLVGASKYGVFFDASLLQQIVAEGLSNPNSCILLLRLNNFQSLEVIEQFCSECECPAPEYSIRCLKGECPDNTCQVDCGDHYCCYNNDGEAVESILK